MTFRICSAQCGESLSSDSSLSPCWPSCRPRTTCRARAAGRPAGAQARVARQAFSALGGADAKGHEMKFSELNAGTAQAEESRWALPYPASSLADPPITLAEALAVDPAQETTLCR